MEIFFVFFQIFNVVTTPLATTANNYQLEINVVNLKNNNGQIAVQLLDERERVVFQQFAPIDNKRSKLTFSGLEKGKYAAQLYHDENSNSKMDFNKLGIPKEGYGFSNDARGFMSAPAFEKQLFSVNKNTAINIKISY